MVLWMEMNLIAFPIEERATAGNQTAASVYEEKKGDRYFFTAENLRL